MITQERLKYLFYLDRTKNILTWRNPPKNKRFLINQEAGCLDIQGYLVIRIDGKNYKAHRLIWLYEYGYLPDKLDHKYGEKSNNEFSLLRECTVSQNAMNRKLSNNNTSGYKGVRFDKSMNKWKVYLTKDYKDFHLGYYKCYGKAIKVRRNAEIEHFGEFRKM